VYLRLGFRDTALMGIALGITGCVLTALLPEDATVWQLAATMFVTGLGMGLSSSPIVVAVQSVVGWERRGTVTGTNMFCRSIGSALGAAAFGAVANATLSARLEDAPADLAGSLPDDVDGTPEALAQGGAVADVVRSALHDAVHGVFVAVALTAVLVAVAIALMPRRTEALVFDD
jgi:MFS family permease